MKKLVLITMILAVLLAGCSGTDATGAATVEIETAYGDLQFPEALEEYLKHMEITEGNVTMEVFYMLLPEGELELFRIYYGAPNMGSEMGFLTIDSKEVPVTYSVCEYIEEDFPDGENWERYFSMMDGFSMILNSIQSDERFSTTRAVEIVQDIKAELTYWEIILPENIQIKETVEGDVYRADFYGALGGETSLLYTIQMGGQQLESLLGYYVDDGGTREISLATNDAVLQENWTEEQRIQLYDMMDTINTVIETVMSDVHYSEELEPAA